MKRKAKHRRIIIPENIGNSVCGVWIYTTALICNALIHIFLFLRFGASWINFIRLFLSFVFFIYPLSYLADLLWSLRPSVCEILSGRLLINRKHYMNSVEKEVDEDALYSITISVPVYMESNDVIFDTLKDSLAAAARYREISGKSANIIVSDDGLAPILGGVCSKDAVDGVVKTFIESPSLLTDNEIKAAQRIRFYRNNDIAFVARPVKDRPGLFKKSSNLNFTLKLGEALLKGESLEELIGENGSFNEGYAEGNIITNEIILLLDKDSGVKEKIIEAIMPEFTKDEKLAYVQCATNAANIYDNYYSYATGHNVNNLFHNIWPCKALQGFFVPLVGHNAFLRKSILIKAGYWSEDKVSEDFDKAICFYNLGYHGKYAQLKGLEFTEYVSRTFTEETGKQHRYAYGLFEMIFDGTIIPKQTRNCDYFYMWVYFFSVINEALLLPTVFIECYFGNIHFLWAGFLLCNVCFIILPCIRGMLMHRYQPKEHSEKILHTTIIALSFVGHSFSMLSGMCRYYANKFKKNIKPFKSTSVDKYEDRFLDGVKSIEEFIVNNKWFILIAILSLDRGIFMSTRKGIEPVTLFAYSYILFCTLFVPVLLTPQLFSGLRRGINTVYGKIMLEIIRNTKRALPSVVQDYWIGEKDWGLNFNMTMPKIVSSSYNKSAVESDVESFLNSYTESLTEVIPLEQMPEDLNLKYSFECCLKKDPSGKKEIYLLRNRADLKRSILRITKDFPQEDAIEEALLLQKLNHPGVPKVHDWYEQDGKKYIVREYIEGRTLYEIIKTGGKLSVQDIFGVMLKLTDILKYLHSQSPPVIHRDIKPQNIIVRKDGGISLIDFGIARVHKEESTHDTAVILTYDYASPEQYGFEQTTPLSDIYSLGVVMLYMATGNTVRTDLESQIVNNKLRTLIEGCIAFNPKERVQSVNRIQKYIIKNNNNKNTKEKWNISMASYILLASLCLFALSYVIGSNIGREKGLKTGYDYGYGIGYTEGYEAVPLIKIENSVEDTKRGNLAGNIDNDRGAFAAYGENTLFYIFNGDIYRMSGSGAESELLVQGQNASKLSYYNGWLYYSSGAEIMQTNIYTLRTDVLHENISGGLNIVNGKYYIVNDSGVNHLDIKDGGINTINENSSYKKLNIDEEKIVYSLENENGLFISGLNGKDKTKVLDGAVRGLCIYNGDIFCSIENTGSGELIKIDGNTGALELIAEVDATSLNVVENGIYFIDTFDETINLISPDGKIRKKITKNKVIDFNIAGDWIFYHDDEKDSGLWCVRVDGTNDHLIQSRR